MKMKSKNQFEWLWTNSIFADNFISGEQDASDNMLLIFYLVHFLKI